jgi:peptidoglycan pentaglycine glycine transferase (the first glycine)
MPQLSSEEWDAFVTGYPQAHLLQTCAWGELKTAFGWQSTHIGDEDGQTGAQVLLRKLPLGLLLAYIPKGPVGNTAPSSTHPASSWTSLWRQVDRFCRDRRVVFLKVEPDLWSSPAEEKPPPGFRSGVQHIQPRRTLLVDLSGDEAAVLAKMKQKTRYNIRLAQKKGVLVTPTTDLDTFHRLMQATGQRDAFGVHSLDYYRRAYEIFHPRGECELFLAELDGEALGGLMVFARGSRAWYFYGASSDQRRETMPAYLLQWEAMRWARARACTTYDLWGVPDLDEDTLEAQFTYRSDGLWGVYRFKRGFGGWLLRSQGSWDRVYRPAGYALYRLGLRLRPVEAG